MAPSLPNLALPPSDASLPAASPHAQIFVAMSLVWGKRCHANSFKDRPVWILTKDGKWCLSKRDLGCVKFWKPKQIIKNNFILKKIKEYFQIFPNWNLYIEKSVLCICVQNFKWISWKWPTDILKVENDHFSRYFPGFLYLPGFQNLPYLGRSKNVLEPFFAFLAKNGLKTYHAIQNQTFYWPFFDSATLDDLDLFNVFSESLGW